MAREPDYGSNHIDPGDANRAYDDHIQKFGDPRRPHFAPDDRATLTNREYALMPSEFVGEPLKTDHLAARVRPEREGPDYNSGMDEAEDATIRVQVGIPTRDRTMQIMRGPATVALSEFIRMQHAYQDTDEALGAQGQFAEIYHITAKLKRMMWDRRNPYSVTTGEVQEALHSLIGHALLMAQLMEEGNKDGRG